METVDRPTTRRALLAAAAGGAAALAARAAAPLTASAETGFSVVLGAANTANATTGLTINENDVDALAPTAMGVTGSAVKAKSANGAAIYAVSGAETAAAFPIDTVRTGVYGFSPVPETDGIAATGVWGDSDDVGVYGTGGLGVLGDGFIGVEGDTSTSGGVGILGFADAPNTTGVYAQANALDRTALKVKGKVLFSRSGRKAVLTGKSSVVITLAGVTTNSLIFAVLSTNRSGRWVRAVVPAAGKFTVYLNTTVPAATNVVWWIIN